MSFEKVNPSHPDKVADRIAGAIVDLAYKKQDNPKIAVEVLIGHGSCHIIAETSVRLSTDEVLETVSRITGKVAIDDCIELQRENDINVDFRQTQQDAHLAKNQAEKIKCGDNGIFKGVWTNSEENQLSSVVGRIYAQNPTDGKFIWDASTRTFIACQSNTDDASEAYIERIARNSLLAGKVIINPLGRWTGGTDVDTGATNRKLGSDMGRAVTGGGLHGKDLSKADVSVNIACHILAQQYKTTVDACCAIGDEEIVFKHHRAGLDRQEKTVAYAEVVEMARDYIKKLGGFEKLAEWGLI